MPYKIFFFSLWRSSSDSVDFLFIFPWVSNYKRVTDEGRGFYKEGTESHSSWILPQTASQPPLLNHRPGQHGVIFKELKNHFSLILYRVVNVNRASSED